MSEILVKTYTRNRDSKSKYYMKDWTAFDICQIMPDGYFTKNKHHGAKSMGIVLLVDGKIPQDYAGGVIRNPDITQLNKSFTSPILGRSQKIIDLTTILTDQQLKEAFNHDLLLDPIRVSQSYLDLFIDRSERTALHSYDKSGSFDNQTVDVGPNGHADANTFLEFESNLDATLTGPTIGDCDEDLDETACITCNGTDATPTNYVEFKASGSGLHAGVWDNSKQTLSVANPASDLIVINDDGYRLTGLQINIASLDGDNRDCVYINSISVTNAIKVSHCIFKMAGNNSYYESAIRIYDADANVEFWNSLVYNLGTRDSTSNTPIYNQSCGTFKIYANTIIGGKYGIVNGGGGSLDVYSNVAFGQANKSYYANQPFNAADMNGWYVTGDQGTNSIDLSAQADTDIFTNPAADDYHAKAGGALENAGKDLDAATPAVTDDIVGTARHATTPELGAFEIVAAGGAVKELLVGACGMGGGSLGGGLNPMYG